MESPDILCQDFFLLPTLHFFLTFSLSELAD